MISLTFFSDFQKHSTNLFVTAGTHTQKHYESESITSNETKMFHLPKGVRL